MDQLQKDRLAARILEGFVVAAVAAVFSVLGATKVLEERMKGYDEKFLNHDRRIHQIERDFYRPFHSPRGNGTTLSYEGERLTDGGSRP